MSQDESAANSSDQKRILVIVPVYNEEGSISEVVAALNGRPLNCDVLYVNDGSHDRSGAILEELGCDLLHHPINLGYLAALRSGLTVALSESYDAAVFFDGDGQHRIDDLCLLVEYGRTHGETDVVIGSRYLGGQRAATPLRDLVARGYSLLTGIMGKRVHDVTSGLKYLSRRAATAMQEAILEDGHAELIIYLLRSGMQIVEVPIQVHARESGTSMYHLTKLLMYPLRTSFLLLVAGVGSSRSRSPAK